jgi:O-antigen/teichoic acid export membrane protein
VLVLGTLPLILRGIGAESFGIWVLLQTFSATTGWLSVPANGLSVSTTREVAAASTANEHSLGRAVGVTVAVFGLSGVLFGLALAAVGPSILRTILDLHDFNAHTLRILSLAFGVQILAEHLCLALTSVLEGLQEVALARSIDALRKTAIAVAGAGAATLDGGLRAVGVSSATAALTVTIASAVVVTKRRQIRPRRPGRAGIRSVVGYAGTVSLLQGTGVLHRTMDRTIAGFAFGPAAVALVEIANQIQLGSTALLTSTTYPMLSSAPWLRARRDDVALRTLLSRLTRYSVLLTLPLVALIVAFAGPFIRLWVGEEFSEAIGLTQVAVLSVALAAPLQAGSNLLQGVGQAGTVVRATGVAVLVNLAASVTLVNSVGVVGVFQGTMVGTLVLTPMLARSIAHDAGADFVTLALNALRRAIPPALAAGVVGALAVALDLPDLLALGGGGAAAVIVGSLVAARWSFEPGERAELVSSLRRGRDPFLPTS